MPVHRPVIQPELAQEIERRRGAVPFQRYVNELLRIALAVDRSDLASDLASSQPKVPPVSQTWRR